MDVIGTASPPWKVQALGSVAISGTSAYDLTGIEVAVGDDIGGDLGPDLVVGGWAVSPAAPFVANFD